MNKVKLLLYCTKTKPYLTMGTDFVSYKKFYLLGEDYGCLNGKIVAECDCEKVEKWFWNGWWECYAKNTDIDIQDINDEDFDKSCLNFERLNEYLKYENGYALHLSNLKIFDEAKELEEFYKDSLLKERVLKAPQNMCRIYDTKGNIYILISIKPEWLCKILNGEKTIEVRKQILRELMELENEKICNSK